MKTRFCLALLTIVLCFSCRSDKAKLAGSRFDSYDIRDLADIRKDGKLKALIAYSGTSYFLYRGQPMGYEYEMLLKLAEHFNLDLELQIARDLNQMLEELRKGNIDIVAHGLAITKERQKIASFTDYLYLTQQVLVQRKPDNWDQLAYRQKKRSLINDAVELIGETVSVRKNSSYYLRLLHLSDELGEDIIIDTLKGNLSTDEIIKMVAEGKIKYTIADSNIAHINASSYPELDVEVPVSSSQRIAWAVRPNASELLEATNTWIRNNRRKQEFNVIFNKYFKNERRYKRRVKSEFYSLNNEQISKYDDIIKMNAAKIDWDWRILASLIYQESQFNTSAKSWAGAKGLMQMMPGTAKELGVNNILDPNDNIAGGSAYLKKMYDRFEEVTDTMQRTKFAMAAYNCGYSHVRDAQRLAEYNGLDPYVWDQSTDQMILALSFPKNYNLDFITSGYVNGKEPFSYVNQIFERYNHYTHFIE
ncbi:MAG: transporter substrate-binding domain-containing protein [Flavobacteriaceae bacterium]